MTTAIGALVLASAIVFFILQPLLSNLHAPLDKADDEATDAEARRRVSLLALRDVEYDFATGKLDEDDYRSLKTEISTEALDAIEATEREATGVGAAPLEDEIKAARERLATGARCGACGFANPGGSRFCSSCGVEMSAGDGVTAGSRGGEEGE